MIMTTENVISHVAGAILAGGKSSRMGVAKAGLALASGRTIFDHVHGCLKEVVQPCVVVGHAEGIALNKYSELQVIPDEVIERGPVGAMLGLFRSNIAQSYLVVGCDQPLLTAGLLRLLLEVKGERPTVFCNEGGSFTSPLPGLYPASLLPIVLQLLSGPRASLRELLEQGKARKIEIDSANWLRLRSANTAQDVEEINTILRYK